MTNHEDPVEFNEIEAEAELMPVEKYSLAILEEAVETRASDVFISDEAQGITIKFRRLGQLHHLRTVARDYGRRMQNHLRAMAGVTLGDAMHPADGRNRVELPGGRVVDLRFSVMPTLYGQDVAMRLFDHERGLIDLDEVGFIDEELDVVKRLLAMPGGILLVAGPTASGKSSSLYAFVRHLNNGKRKIHTLEDPVEYAIRGVIQSQVNLKAGLDFPELLHTVLRHSPDVIMIGEIRDNRTAEIAIRAANSGQVVLATVHAPTAASAIQSMIAYGVNPQFLANSVTGIVAQRLVRKLCPNCRIRISGPDAPDPLASLRARLPLNQPVQWYEPGGCTLCHEVGYERLTLIAEVLEMNKEMRKAVASHCSAEQLNQLAIDNGMLTLEDSARINVARGVTSPEEVSRVLGSASFSELNAFFRETESFGNVSGNGSEQPPDALDRFGSGRWTSNSN